VSLFAKILLWFWAALAVMIATLVLLESASRERGVPLPRAAAMPWTSTPTRPGSWLAHEGRPGLERMLDRLGSDSDLRAYCVDSAGLEITGARCRPGARGRALRVPLERGRLRRGPSGSWRLPAAREGPPRLALVFEPPAGPPRFVPFLPRDCGCARWPCS